LDSPLPSLPLPDVETGRHVFYVQFHPQLRTLATRYLTSLLRDSGAEFPKTGARAETGSKEHAEYEAALERMLRSVRIADRRLGLHNLCWLAHSRDVAESLRDLEGKAPTVRKLKYSLHPLLSSFYKRIDNGARRAVEQGDPVRGPLLVGMRENVALVDAIIEDGFAFTELSIADFDFNHFLASNKRYRLSADIFFEMYSILFRET